MSTRIVFELEVPDTGFERVIRALVERRGRLSRDQAARIACMSPSHFSRSFAKAHGHTFAEAKTVVRMRTALALLSRSSLRISEIAETLGYADPVRFRRAFKARYGLPPATFRTGGERTPGSVGRLRES